MNIKIILQRTFKDPTYAGFAHWQNVIAFFIFTSCLALSLETVPEVYTAYPQTFRALEWLSVVIFTVDYFGNLLLSEKRLKYAFTFWGIVDLVSILPSYLMWFNLTALRGTKVLRLLRVARVLRVLKLTRSAVNQSQQASEKEINPIVANLKIYFIIFFSVLMISSTCMYYFEGGLYTPDAIKAGQKLLDRKVSNGISAEKFVPKDPITKIPIPEDKRYYTSIPASMWWCITTLTSTGYGDMYPSTAIGRFIAALTMFSGLVLFGILLNIISKTIMVVLFGESL
ncbi:MAG: ion transporter [Spirochaetota bacterium]